MKKKLLIMLFVLVAVFGLIWGVKQLAVKNKNISKLDFLFENTKKEIKVGLIGDYLMESPLVFYKVINTALENEKKVNPLLKSIVYPEGGTVFKEGKGREEKITQLLDDGVNLLMSLSFNFASAIKKQALLHPEVEFVLLDGFLPGEYPQNVTSYHMPFAEMGFLAGTIAGLNSKREKVAVLLDAHSLESDELAAGFMQGVKYVAPNCVIETIFIKKLSEAITEGKDKDLLMSRLRDMSNRGVDIVFSNVSEADMLIVKNANQYDFKLIISDTDYEIKFTNDLAKLPEKLQKYCIAGIFIDYGKVLSNICQDFINGSLKHKDVKIPVERIMIAYDFQGDAKGVHLAWWERVNKIQQDILIDKIKVNPVLEHGGVYQ